MTIPVPVDTVARELDALWDDALAYLNRKTGECLTVPCADMLSIEDGAEDSDSFEWPWSPEELTKLREIAAGDDWFALPDKFEIHEWSIMDRFTREVPEPLASKLSRAIHGRGAFRQFHDTLHECGGLDAWYEFKHEYLVKLVSDALTEEGVPFRRDGV